MGISSSNISSTHASYLSGSFTNLAFVSTDRADDIWNAVIVGI